MTPRTLPHPGDAGCLDSEAEPPPRSVPVSPRPPSKKGKKGAEAAAAASSEEHVYRIRDIRFFGMKRRILCAPEGLGPCPLLALSNVLLLRNQLAMPEGVASISSQDLVAKIMNLVVDLHVGSHVANDARCAEIQHGVDVAMEVLPSFKYGLELDCRFSGPSSFEERRELAVFELLEVSILHAWVVSPFDKEAHAVVSPHSYNELRQRLADLEEVKQRLDSEGATDRGLEADELQTLLADVQVIEDVDVIRNFLDRSASQLTYEGIIQLHEVMGDRELAIFFRNSVFEVMLRHKDELFLLCMDPSFLDTPVVWERLAAVDSDTAYLDTDLRVPGTGPGAPATPRLPAPPAMPRGPRLEGGAGTGEHQQGEMRCRRCGIINRFPAVPGHQAPMLRCGSCGEVQARDG